MLQPQSFVSKITTGKIIPKIEPAPLEPIWNQIQQSFHHSYSSELTVVEEQPKTEETKVENRNVLNPSYRCPSELVDIVDSLGATDRFSLLGGLKGVLAMFSRIREYPDVKTYTQVNCNP